MNENIGPIVANRVKVLAKEKRAKLGAILKELGLGVNTVSNWENGAVPLIDKLYVLSDYFQVSIDFLVGKTDIKYTEPNIKEYCPLGLICQHKKFTPIQLDKLADIICAISIFWEDQ